VKSVPTKPVLPYVMSTLLSARQGSASTVKVFININSSVYYSNFLTYSNSVLNETKITDAFHDVLRRFIFTLVTPTCITLIFIIGIFKRPYSTTLIFKIYLNIKITHYMFRHVFCAIIRCDCSSTFLYTSHLIYDILQ
jgi:hypothetical protein